MTTSRKSSGRRCRTALTDQGRLRLSVHVAPRLRNERRQRRRRASSASFRRSRNGRSGATHSRSRSQIRAARPVRADRATLADPAIWAGLLPPGTRVGPHAFQDHAKRDLHVFPVRPCCGFLEQAYGAAAAAGPDLPVDRRSERATGAVRAVEPDCGASRRLTVLLGRAERAPGAETSAMVRS